MVPHYGTHCTGKMLCAVFFANIITAVLWAEDGREDWLVGKKK